ncbi:MAG: amino acid racemase [archaeon]|nr:amino acid racemase [archaeon]
MNKIVGVIGGLGPEAGCSFYLNVNHKIRKTTTMQPHLVIDNLPVSRDSKSKITMENYSLSILELLKESVKRFNLLKVDFIVIPCNTAHMFIKELREMSSVPIISIIEETAKECKRSSFKTVGVLSTTNTAKSNLYLDELKKQKIKLISPEPDEQQFLSKCVRKIVNLEDTSNDKQKMLEIIQKLKEKGAEAVILGCTELFLLVSAEDSPLPIIDSKTVLENVTVNKLITS